MNYFNVFEKLKESEKEEEMMRKFQEFLEEESIKGFGNKSSETQETDNIPPIPSENSGAEPPGPRDGDYRSQHSGHQIIMNSAHGKPFYVCKDCGVEVVDDPPKKERKTVVDNGWSF